MISVKLGLRNLLRNRWRSGLTLAAVAVAVGLMVWTLAFYEGWLTQMIRATTAVETTQAQLHTAEYVRNPRVYRTFGFGPDRLRAAAAVPGVLAVSPRVELNGLIGNEQRSQVGRFHGIDPAMETAATPVAEGITAGRWLAASPPDYPAPREAVLGHGLAAQLRATPGEELVVFLEAADGSLGNELLEVVGIVRTGNTQVDRTAIYLHIEDARYLAALGDDDVHEVAVRTADLDGAGAVADALAAALGVHRGLPDDSVAVAEELVVVQPWQEIIPDMNAMIALFRNSYWIMYLMIYLVAAVGILNTQRMSALERRREFGVMMAIGMRPRRMFRTLVAETLVLGLVGALIGATLGGLLGWYHATAGLDMSLLTDQTTFSYMGVAFSERMYSDMSASAVVQPVLVMLFVALVSGLVPAFAAARIDPAPTIAGRT